MYATCIFLVGSTLSTLAETPGEERSRSQTQNTETNTTVFVQNGQPMLIREIGLGWEFETGRIEIHGKKSLLYAGRALGGGDFHLKAKLAVQSRDDTPTFVVGTDSAGINGFRRLTYGFWPREVLRHQHLFIPTRRIQTGKPFTFEIIRKGSRNVVLVDRVAVHHFIYGGEFDKIGFCSYEGTLHIHDFSVRGRTAPRN